MKAAAALRVVTAVRVKVDINAGDVEASRKIIVAAGAKPSSREAMSASVFGLAIS